MMDYRSLLASFQGRIGRGRYWRVTLGILGSMIAALLLLTVICGAFGIATGPVAINIIGISASIEPADGDKAVKAALFPHVATILMTLGFAWFFVAASIKRLHDRNRSGWWATAFLLLPSVLNTLWDWLDNPNLALLVSALGFGLSIWGFVELLCLRGTRGPNRFGPDPLAPPEPGPNSGACWDQQSELEFVPLSASPSTSSHGKRGHD
jgi:uncharacterized membrane protein YhaH (DUF805 family)